MPKKLFNDLLGFFNDRLYLLDGDAFVLAVWTTFGWSVEAFATAPYLCIRSGGPGCGKSVTMDLLSSVARNGMYVTTMSRAVLVRSINTGATIFLDEAEALNRRDSFNADLLAVLHQGYRRPAVVPILIGGTVREFNVFGPKAFAAIGGLSGALLDRSIIIDMQPKPASFVAAPIGHMDVAPLADSLKKRLVRQSARINPKLRKLVAQRPPGGYWPELMNREVDLWDPLLSVARVLGPDIEEQALSVVQIHQKRKSAWAETDPHVAKIVALLEVLRQRESSSDAPKKFTPGDLVSALQTSEAWALSLEGRTDAACAAQIGRFLRGFFLKSRQRVNGHSRYRVQEVMEVLERHVPKPLRT